MGVNSDHIRIVASNVVLVAESSSACKGMTINHPVDKQQVIVTEILACACCHKFRHASLTDEQLMDLNLKQALMNQEFFNNPLDLDGRKWYGHSIVESGWFLFGSLCKHGLKKKVTWYNANVSERVDCPLGSNKIKLVFPIIDAQSSSHPVTHMYTESLV